MMPSAADVGDCCLVVGSSTISSSRRNDLQQSFMAYTRHGFLHAHNDICPGHKSAWAKQAAPAPLKFVRRKQARFRA